HRRRIVEMEERAGVFACREQIRQAPIASVESTVVLERRELALPAQLASRRALFTREEGLRRERMHLVDLQQPAEQQRRIAASPSAGSSSCAANEVEDAGLGASIGSASVGRESTTRSSSRSTRHVLAETPTSIRTRLK